jgi:hypothetical protein
MRTTQPLIWHTVLLLALLAAAAACTPSDSPSDGEPTDALRLAQLDPVPAPDTTQAQQPTNLSRGQTLYVPIYSHIYFKNQERTIDLAATVSIRNTDSEHAIVLSTIDYIDNYGQPVRQYIDQPRVLEPMASTSVLIEERDAAGGLGANFIIEWSAEQPVHTPVIESIMISTRSSLGISFTSPARVLTER